MATTNSLHISLNFDPSEKLSMVKLTDITKTYMEKIGFGNQPYLVYQHYDAGHPHVHIVTTNIRTDGTRINTHNIGRNQSETARKEIEKQFGLVQASGRQFREINRIHAVDPGKVIYGKSETKRAITNVLDVVIKQYKYTSLAQLNAILRQYNVLADRGLENSLTYKSGGLVYRVLDKDGNKVGVPIKASSIYNKPTLANLEKKFPKNKIERKPHQQSIKERIDKVLEKWPDLQAFVENLNKKGIDTVLRQNETGFLYGITFVDHKTKTVFNGSDLGKEYSAAAIRQKIQISALRHLFENKGNDGKPQLKTIPTDQTSKEQTFDKDFSKSSHILDQLLQAEKNPDRVPYDLVKKKRKKKKRNLGL